MYLSLSNQLEEFLHNLKRPFLLIGITQIFLRGVHLYRTIPLILFSIEDHSKKTLVSPPVVMIFSTGFQRRTRSLKMTLLLNRLKVFGNSSCTDHIHTQMIIEKSANSGFYLVTALLDFHWPSMSCVIFKGFLIYGRKFYLYLYYRIERGTSAIQYFFNNFNLIISSVLNFRHLMYFQGYFSSKCCQLRNI